MTESSDYESVQVFIGVDVGKDTHHAVAINRSGKRLLDKALPNDENKLRSLISDLKQHGQILLVVDQPATIGALPVAVARSEGVLVGYLPGLAMRRIADLHAGEAKTDSRDAVIIAEAARTLPHALRTLKLADEQIAELSMLLPHRQRRPTTVSAVFCPRYIRHWSAFSVRDLITRRYSIFSSDIPHQKNSLRWMRRSWQPSSANLRLVWVNALQQT